MSTVKVEPIPHETPAYIVNRPSTPSDAATHFNTSALRSSLTLTTLPVPQPPYPANHVLVRITHASLNYRDAMIAVHSPLYPGPHKQDLIPLGDGAGYVAAVSGMTKDSWRVGERVMLHQNSWVEGTDVRDFDIGSVYGAMQSDGTLVRYKLVPEARLIRVPDYMTLAEAATIPTAAGTATSMLFYGPNSRGGLGIRAGEWVLTQGTGGVSIFCLQLAVAAGAKVIVTSSSDEKLEIAKKLGARETVNYKKYPNWADEVLKITGNRGVDQVMELGGSGTIEQSLKATTLGGIVNVGGVLSMPEKTDLIQAIMLGAKIVRGSLAMSKSMTQECMRIMEAHQVHPVIAHVFDWNDVPKAYETLVKQKTIGKIVIQL